MCELLVRAKLDQSKPIATLITSNYTLSTSEGELFNNPIMYRSIVEALQYIKIIRFELSFAINKACQLMVALQEPLWYSIKCILKYLKDIICHGLVLRPSSHFLLQEFVDAD